MNFVNYENDIIAKSKSYTIPNMEWQDIAQELRILLWQKLGKFKGKNNAKERTFAIKIMRNRIFDLFKTANRKKRLIDSYHLSLDEIIEKEFSDDTY